MDSPCTEQVGKKNLLLLIFCIACMVLPGYSGKRKAKKEEKPEEDEATVALKLAVEHFQQGSSLYENKKLDDAIGEYREALRGDPEEPYWHQALGKALEDKGDLQGALEEYRIASQQSPLDAGLRSKYEELAGKLHVNIGTVSAETKPIKTSPISAEQFKPSEGATPPIPTYQPEPRYSVKARSVKYQGSTVLSIMVDAEGNVEDTRVVTPLGVGLDEIALETIRNWKFKPATRGGLAVPVHVFVEISFKLF